MVFAVQWNGSHPAEPLRIGEISIQGGGQYGEHRGTAHAEGRGVDIGLFRNDGQNLSTRYQDTRTYNQMTVQAVVTALGNNPDVRRIIFNDPQVTANKLVRDSKGIHDNHIHVEFGTCYYLGRPRNYCFRENDGQMKLTKLIGTLFAAGVVVLAMTAIHRNLRHSTDTNGVTSGPVQDLSSPLDESQVTINSVQFFAWWWSDQQIASGIDIKNAPPKETYVHLERWQNLGDAEVPHPDRVDIVCSITNRGKQSAYLTISATGDFKVASYAYVESREKKNKTLDEVLEAIPWSKQKELGVQVLESVAPGETREVKFKDFNLRSVLDEYSAGRNGDLWSWKLRVRVEVKSSVGLGIARSEKVLDLIPGD